MAIGKYKVAHLLGVTRDHEEIFREAEQVLTLQGYICFAPAIYDKEKIGEHLDMLNDMCYEKLCVADICVLVTLDHIGQSTTLRVIQALNRNIPVYIYKNGELAARIKDQIDLCMLMVKNGEFEARVKSYAAAVKTREGGSPIEPEAVFSRIISVGTEHRFSVLRKMDDGAIDTTQVTRWQKDPLTPDDLSQTLDLMHAFDRMRRERLPMLSIPELEAAVKEAEEALFDPTKNIPAVEMLVDKINKEAQNHG